MGHKEDDNKTSKGTGGSLDSPVYSVKERAGQQKALEKKNKKGETPLHAAAVRGDVLAVGNYLELGADPNTTDHAGWSPLHEAAGAGRNSCAYIIVDDMQLV
jgi:ankyrin repeat protein